MKGARYNKHICVHSLDSRGHSTVHIWTNLVSSLTKIVNNNKDSKIKNVMKTDCVYFVQTREEHKLKAIDQSSFFCRTILLICRDPLYFRPFKSSNRPYKRIRALVDAKQLITPNSSGKEAMQNMPLNKYTLTCGVMGSMTSIMLSYSKSSLSPKGHFLNA